MVLLFLGSLYLLMLAGFVWMVFAPTPAVRRRRKAFRACAASMERFGAAMRGLGQASERAADAMRPLAAALQQRS